MYVSHTFTRACVCVSVCGHTEIPALPKLWAVSLSKAADVLYVVYMHGTGSPEVHAYVATIPPGVTNMYLRSELTHQEMREEVEEHVAHHSSHGKAQQYPLEPATGLGCAIRDKWQDQCWDRTDEPGGKSRIAPCVLHERTAKGLTQQQSKHLARGSLAARW